MFAIDQDGYINNIYHVPSSSSQSDKLHKDTMREYFTYHLQFWQDQFSILLYLRWLLQQYIIDTYTMIKAQRLSFIRHNEEELRVEIYNGLEDALLRVKH